MRSKVLLMNRVLPLVSFISLSVLNLFGGELIYTADGQHSIESILARSRSERKAGDTVRIEVSGRHFLTKTLVLSEVDSHTTFQAKGTNAVISGGRLLNGWKNSVTRPGLWETALSDAGATNVNAWVPRALFVNGQRRQRARTPNSGFFHIQGASPQGKPGQFVFKAGDLKKLWADAGDVEIVANIAWTDLRMPLRSVDEAAHTATLAGEPIASIKEENAQYYVENAPDALDVAGEWRFDGKSGLQYWPLPGENIQSVEVIAPVLEQLLIVRGNPQSRKAAEGIAFQGITFAHTNYRLPEKGFADPQAAVGVHGDLLFEFARDCELQNCALAHLSGYGLETGRGAQHIRIRDCELTDLGAGGIRIGETAQRAEPFDTNHSNEISDCHLHGLGRIFAPGVGILILQSGTNLVAHNEINDLYYTAISVGWNWGYQETPCRANRIEFNHLHHIGQGVLSDMGGIYTLGIQRGTVLYNNLIHDIDAYTYGGWGLYTDEGSTEIRLENNIVYRCKSAGFHQHYGRDNVVRNNIFAFNKEHQLMRTREEAHTSFYFERNIVVFDSGDLLGSNWGNNHYMLDHNVYWDTRPDRRGKMFGGQSLEEWRKRNHDPESVVADPQLMEAKKDDFRLKPESIAFKLGFNPIDMSTVGPRSQRQNH